MTDVFNIAVFAGDGIGPEIMAPTIRLLDQVQNVQDAYRLAWLDLPAGAAHYAETGEALPEKSLSSAQEADAILLSAMGLPHVRYQDGTEIAPQIDLRKILGLYAGVRPVVVPTASSYSALKPLSDAVDFVLVRESTEGLFHTSGAGEVTATEARETLLITRATSEKLFRFSFELARERKAAGISPGRVTCVDKANIFRAFAFFRGIFKEIAQEYPDIESDMIYVDAAALKMVKQPQAFDVMVTENMFGDILSDLGAGLMGGLGVAPSADIGDGSAVFQPCHGSAPDIAGRGVANPVAMILSAVLMLEWLGRKRHIGQMVSDAARIRQAVEAVLAEGAILTGDLGGKARTDEFSDAVATRL